jgi:hypothetical protein
MAIETYDLTETERLVIEQDEDAGNPRKEWDMATGFVKIGGRGDSRRADVEPVHGDPVRIAEAHDRMGNFFTRSRYDGYEPIVERWARVFHGMHLEYDSEHGGYWFVSPDQVRENVALGADWDKLERQAEIIASDRETYRQWADGEVYTVAYEKLAEWHRTDDSGVHHVREEWQNEESISGMYMDVNESGEHFAGNAALDYFSMSDEAEAAARALIAGHGTYVYVPEKREPVPGVSHSVGGEW